MLELIESFNLGALFFTYCCYNFLTKTKWTVEKTTQVVNENITTKTRWYLISIFFFTWIDLGNECNANVAFINRTNYWCPINVKGIIEPHMI